mgnify:FL=1
MYRVTDHMFTFSILLFRGNYLLLARGVGCCFLGVVSERERVEFEKLLVQVAKDLCVQGGVSDLGLVEGPLRPVRHPTRFIQRFVE